MSPELLMPSGLGDGTPSIDGSAVTVNAADMGMPPRAPEEGSSPEFEVGDAPASTDEPVAVAAPASIGDPVSPCDEVPLMAPEEPHPNSTTSRDAVMTQR